MDGGEVIAFGKVDHSNELLVYVDALNELCIHL